jgi:hypothetical protein
MRVASAIRYRHCTGAQDDGKPRRVYLQFEMLVAHGRGSQPTALRLGSRFTVVRQKAEAHEAAKTFSSRADMRD